MPVAGVVGPAKVVGLSGGVLRLEYSSDYEGLRGRGLKIVDDINIAFTDMAGMEISCSLLPADGLDPSKPAQRAFGGLSIAEITEISKDPAVQALVEEFNATVEIQRDPDFGLMSFSTESMEEQDED